MDSVWVPHPKAGQRLLPNVIDDLARDEPARVIFEEALGDGFRKTTVKKIANAINRTAWWLETHLGGKGVDFETLGYIGPGDIRYLILVVAAIKTGYKMLFMSPRNSLQGHLAVLEASKCKIWLQPSDGENLESMLNSRPMKTFSFPDVSELLESGIVEHYPYDRAWEIAKNDPGWVLHTSGSTGLPKPIVRTVGSASLVETHRLCEPIGGRKILTNDMIGSRIYSTLPLFHSLGMTMALHWPIFYNQTVIIDPRMPPTVNTVCQVLETAKPNVLLCSPSLLEEFAEEAEAVNRLSNLKAVAFGGGPLAEKAGNTIALKTHLMLILGSTESGWLPAVEKDREDWNFIHFHPNAGLELRPHPSGFYELFIVKDSKLESWQTIFSTFPDLTEYSFNDLFSKHPTKPDLWHHEGRADNIIVLSNGEKLNPLSLELTISDHPFVRAVIIAGYARFQTSAIIEVTEKARHSMKNGNELLDTIWPAIEAANQKTDSHGKLHREFVMLALPEKPFLRAGKGTVQKSLTLDLYSEELEELYQTAEDRSTEIVQINGSDVESMKKGISRLVSEINDCEIGGDEDFFARGFDSLQISTLLRRLRRSLEAYCTATSKIPLATLTSKLIYSNPTINKLSAAIFNLFGSQSDELPDAKSSSITDMQAMLDKYVQLFPILPGRKSPSPENESIVLLTGSTGSLGSFILEHLLKSTNVKEIWCLNRSEDAHQRQAGSNLLRGLETKWEPTRVKFISGNACQPKFGLQSDVYKMILAKTTHIIHNAWKVDFNLALSSFEPHVAGMSHMIEFASCATHDVSLLFTSSVGTLQNWNSDKPVPEIPLSDFSVASRGYGKSKLVAERLLVEATKRGLVLGKVVRIGQIAGPVGYGVKGEWNTSEWIPTLIRASAHIGILPSSLGKFDHIKWIPVDLMAQVIVELNSIFPTSREPVVFHATNPHSSRWSLMVPAIQRHVPKLKLVSLQEWVMTHRKAVEASDDPSSIPGANLLDFFEGFKFDGPRLELETVQTVTCSPTLEQIGATSEEWMDLWMKQWKESGTLLS